MYSKAVQQTTAIALNRAYTLYAYSEWLKGVIIIFQNITVYTVFLIKKNAALVSTREHQKH